MSGWEIEVTKSQDRFSAFQAQKPVHLMLGLEGIVPLNTFQI